MFGSPLMFDAGRPESHHQTFCKKPAKKCQKTHKNWTSNIAKKIDNEHAFSIFRKMMKSDKQPEQTLRTQPLIRKRSTKYSVFYDNERNTIGTEWRTRTDARTLNLDQEMLRFMIHWYNIKDTDEELTCFTECLVRCDDGTDSVVRCHPNYLTNGPWYDWGLVRFNRRIRPAKFYCFVDIGNDKTDAIVELASNSAEHVESVLTKSWPFPLENNNMRGTSYHCISMKDYQRPCLVFEKKTSYEIIEVLPYQRWHEQF